MIDAQGRPDDQEIDGPDLPEPHRETSRIVTRSAQELGRFLRIRRDRIRPEQVGFPVGPRRRSLGLRREEVAVLAGVSPTWYTYLEQGRNITPSPEVLDSLANVLMLTAEERRYLHLLALGRAPAGQIRVASPDDELWTLVRAVGNGQHPVYIGNEYGDVLAWNEATAHWFTDFHRYPRERRNMLWWLLTDPEAPERVLDWAEETRDLIARLRSAWAGRPEDPAFNARIDNFSAASAQFRTWWAEHHVTAQQPRDRVLQRPGQQRQAFRIVVLRLADSSSNSVVVHLPTTSS